MSLQAGDPVEAFIGALLDDDPEELYDRAPCGYLSTTPDGTVVKANRTLLTLLGYERDELVGRMRFVELLSAGGRIYHETHYAPMLRMQGTAREIALDLVRKDGSRLPVLVNSVLERDAAGTPLVVRTAVFDATQRREYERELLRAKERAEASEAHARRLAQTLQQTLIPLTPPAIPQLDVAAEYRPAGDGTEVGGDFYDVFQLGPGDWAITIGDVCGKGVDAAVVTALARYTLRAASVRHDRPHEALQVLNQVLLQQQVDRFCTVAMLRLRQAGGRWHATLSSGGHPLPLLRPAAGGVERVGRPGTLLGAFPDVDLHDEEISLAPGDLLLLVTDGVAEARNGAELYGEARLAAVAAGPHESAAALAGALLSDVLEFQHNWPRDDIAIVAVGGT